jgi:succinoglycan biosynthesis protein ExoA
LKSPLTELSESDPLGRGLEDRAESKAPLPYVSVVVIAKDEEKTVGKCISSILRQKYPHFEIIFVDSNSTDRTPEIIKSLVRPDRRVVLAKSREGAAAARNEGLRLARGQAIAFVDGDCYLDDDWLRRAVIYLLSAKDARVAAVGGPFVQVPLVRSRTALTISEIESTALGRGGSTRSHREGNPSYAKSLSLSGAVFWSHVVRQIGFLDEKLQYCEDSDFCHRTRLAGYKLLSFGDLGAFHTPKYASLKEFAVKMWNYGVGRGRAVRHDRTLMTRLGLAALAYSITFSAALILAFTFSFVGSALVVILLGTLYLATISAFSILVSWRLGSVRSFFLSIAAFIALHIPYTTGLLVGIVTPKRHRDDTH